MSNQVDHHPDLALLRNFFDGSLSVGFSMAVSAHVDDCAVCRQCVSELAVSTCNDWYDAPAEEVGLDDEFADMLSGIVNSPELAPDTALAEAASSEGPLQTVVLRGRTVRMPHVLQQFVATGFHWREIGKGIHQALLDVDPSTKCEIILMEPGAKVPRHRHMGREFMLVLDGSISDGEHNYGVSDFVLSDQKVHHGQETPSGCICLFVTDAPLEFTEGLARLLNPVNRAKHWWSARKA